MFDFSSDKLIPGYLVCLTDRDRKALTEEKAQKEKIIKFQATKIHN